MSATAALSSTTRTDGSGTLTVTNSTFSGNRTYHLGGGIYNDGGATLTVNNSTFSGNWGDIFNAGSITIGSTILNGVENLYNYGTVTSLGYNLSSYDAGGLLTAIGDRINADSMLRPFRQWRSDLHPCSLKWQPGH